MEVTGYVMRPEKPPRRWRTAWGYFAIAGDGTVYLPGVVAADRMAVLLCAAHDGVGMVSLDGTSLYPAWWLAREFPRCAADVAHIVERIREGHPEATAVSVPEAGDGAA